MYFTLLSKLEDEVKNIASMISLYIEIKHEHALLNFCRDPFAASDRMNLVLIRQTSSNSLGVCTLKSNPFSTGFIYQAMNSFMAHSWLVEGPLQPQHKRPGSLDRVIGLTGSLDQRRADDDTVGDLSNLSGLLCR